MPQGVKDNDKYLLPKFVLLSMSYYSCAICDHPFGSSSHCTAKRRRFHVTECRQCNRRFKNDHALQQVSTSWLDKISFTQTNSIPKHNQNSPNHAKPYPCALCNRSFGAQEALNKHIQARHYWCFTCSRSFPSHKVLKKVSSKYLF